MFKNLTREIENVGKDKGIKKEVLIEALESALLTAARKIFGAERDIEAHYNEDAGEIELFEFKTVVEQVKNPHLEIDPKEALKHDTEAQLGDSIGVKMNANDLGRIAAQAAKQVIIQKVRDAEREIVYSEYIDRKGELVAGIVRRIEKRDIIIDLGKTEAVLPETEQVPREFYRPGDRIQGYVVDVLKSARNKPQIVISRANSGLLVKLFENEVPEIYEGIVRIESAAREAGGRAKIAVSSKDPDVDPVGACVGMKGSRVQNVVQELRGEKIDIVPFDKDPAKFVCNAIAPAEVARVIINEENKSMELIVADDQLSLAIGKKGQNVRLASKLSGWKIDIQSESKVKEMAETAKKLLMKIEGIGEQIAEILNSQGVAAPEALAQADIDSLANATGLSKERVEELKKAAALYLEKNAAQAANAEKSQVISEEGTSQDA